MIILREFEVGMNISDTIMFYADDGNMLQVLRKIYTGKCLFGALIIEITRIIVASECMINQDGNPNFGTVSIKFEARADVYTYGEIINGVKIDNIGVDVITCSTPKASILIRTHSLLRYLKQGQIISVRVGAAKYTRSENKIAVSATPMLPSANYNVYRIAPVSDNVDNVLKDVRERIAAEEAAKITTGHGNDVWKMFDTLLYAYKTPQKPIGKVISIADLPAQAIGEYICRDPRLGSDASVCILDELPADATLTPMINFDATLSALLEDYCACLRTIREMIEIYKGPLVAEHNNLWKIFVASKQ